MEQKAFSRNYLASKSTYKETTAGARGCLVKSWAACLSEILTIVKRYLPASLSSHISLLNDYSIRCEASVKLMLVMSFIQLCLFIKMASQDSSQETNVEQSGKSGSKIKRGLSKNLNRLCDRLCGV